MSKKILGIVLIAVISLSFSGLFAAATECDQLIQNAKDSIY